MPSRSVNSAWLPGLVSISLHGLIAAIIAFYMNFTNTPESLGNVIFDTRVSPAESETEIQLSMVELPSQKPRRQKSPATETTLPTMPVVALPHSNSKSTTPAVMPAFTQSTAFSHPPAMVSHGSAVGNQGVNRPASMTSFFQVPAHGRSVVYVLDRSTSMGFNDALSALKRELRASLAQLPDDAQFQVIFYNRVAEPMRIAGATDLLIANAANKEAVIRRVEELRADGGTEHLPALQMALSYHPDVIYFLTDADDLSSEQVRVLTQLNRGRTAIHSFEFCLANRTREELPLHVLARQNRGLYHAVSVQLKPGG